MIGLLDKAKKMLMKCTQVIMTTPHHGFMP